ncbi:MAG: hypothetical protein ACKOCJ_04835 [Burkholderiaceae bacterium]
MDTATPLQHTPHRPRASGLRRAPSVATAAACATLAWGAFTAGAFTTSALAQTQAPGQPRSPAQSVRPIDLGKAELLRKSPPDLTQLAKRNSGVLPMARLYDSITGDGIAAHGTRDMPVWGSVYRETAANYYMDVPYDPEAYTRARVLLLLEYVGRLQQK